MSRTAEKQDEYIHKMAGMGYEAHGLITDAADFATLTQAFKQLHTTLGPTKVLVYNAAAYRQAKPSKLSAEDLELDFRINVASALHATHQVLPSIREQGGGSIIFTGGGVAFEPMPAWASLGVGKAGLRNLTFSLHAELAPENIHVAIVSVCGMVKAGTRFDPDTIADAFWELHEQAPGKREREIEIR